ncbi:MAG: molybdenum cofactor biosynthesis protein MoaE [Candidatus Omnitrophica bacterium]|nr:molybdenum cofactor biosynthesis protein MoaE [Candidatus Omnitrophota bacterium]
MFKLSSEPLNITPYLVQMRDPSAGAFTSFEGWVRNHHQGQKVVALEYEALPALCESEAHKIFNEAKEQFEVTKMICLHRVGHLLIGDMSIWVGVSAPHRDAAFKACRYIVDELKKRLPIWKKEILTSGQSHWVNCQDASVMNLKVHS